MQRHGPRHFTAYTITAIVYLSVVIAIYYSQTHTFASSKETQENVIHMALSSFVPKPVEPEKIVEEVVKEIVEPIEEKKEEVVPEPVVQKVMPKPIIKKPKKEIKKIVKPKPVKKAKKKTRKNKKIVKKKVVHKKVSRQQASFRQSKSTPAQRNKFWSALRTKIDRHKFYPRMAKKRGMEGLVKVRFTILSSGKEGSISVTGDKIFYNSARNAVKSAFPIDASKSPVGLPTSINLTLHYQIR